MNCVPVRFNVLCAYSPPPLPCAGCPPNSPPISVTGPRHIRSPADLARLIVQRFTFVSVSPPTFSNAATARRIPILHGQVARFAGMQIEATHIAATALI